MKRFVPLFTLMALALLGTIFSSNAGFISGMGNPISAPELTGGTVIDFESGPTGFYSSVTIGNVTFDVDPDPNLALPFEWGGDWSGQFNTSGDISLYSSLAGPRFFTITFSTPVDAFAFNWGGTEYAWELRAFDSTGYRLDTYLLPAVGSSNAGDFFGIAAPDIAFATLFHIDNGDLAVIDNFTFANSQNSTPELSTLVMFGLALLSIIGMGLRQRRK